MTMSRIYLVIIYLLTVKMGNPSPLSRAEQGILLFFISNKLFHGVVSPQFHHVAMKPTTYVYIFSLLIPKS